MTGCTAGSAVAAPTRTARDAHSPRHNAALNGCIHHHESRQTMDIVRFRAHLTRDYAEYVHSFVRIGTPDVRAVVERTIGYQRSWPIPKVQFNPSCRPGIPVLLPRPR